jgi:archaemetzincin
VPFRFPENDKIELDFIAEGLNSQFHSRAQIIPAKFDPQMAYEAFRNQYNSTEILSMMLNELPSPDAKMLGVTDLDLFIPVLSYVFGEAQLNGNAAVVSSHRLRPEYYGLASDRTVFRKRLIKESVHECGHLFGLLHCPVHHCVMRTSTYAEHIDTKTDRLCSLCRNLLL